MLTQLTTRERDALRLVGRGLYKQSDRRPHGDQLRDAKTHVDRAMTKLHARDRAQLVILAYESGLIIARGP